MGTLLQTLKDNMRLHFDIEQKRYCEVPNYNCVDHMMKHYRFWVVLEDQKAPVNCEEINWAKNWLAQHIKNTDHQYKKRLLGPDTGDNSTGRRTGWPSTSRTRITSTRRDCWDRTPVTTSLGEELAGPAHQEHGSPVQEETAGTGHR